ncbi:hypothetical protein [aff. Roholtiella sp. LEGE 12411]|uniref:hypothetical protein n=1 Tax=aff. Roholtiella sp. LEGE 12411 TaxID=1828822 RepID=UPI0018818A7B|nr:hypothetical protein [aff. Roholtiella sp. LEGE 12411]MBE9034218.1 hypothetical protein [aff. Roholtiella sp. LEGE 12411]
MNADKLFVFYELLSADLRRSEVLCVFICQNLRKIAKKLNLSNRQRAASRREDAFFTRHRALFLHNVTFRNMNL